MPAHTKVKLYVGCSLTQAPPDFVVAVEKLKSELSAKYEIMDFLGLTKGTATDVYNWDIGRNIATCDLFVAVCDYPALGLGYELAAAVEKYHKPVLAVARRDAHITRLVLGIDAPNYDFVRYDLLQDVVAMVDEKITSLGLKPSVLNK
jgi:hypothetical protein